MSWTATRYFLHAIDFYAERMVKFTVFVYLGKYAHLLLYLHILICGNKKYATIEIIHLHL